jgi:hypothetical protein
MCRGASLRRRKFRLQTGVTKMVCRSVDWPIARGGRSITWAARRRSKGLKSPAERRKEEGLCYRLGTPDAPPLPPRRPKDPYEVAAALLRERLRLSGNREGPPPLPPRRQVGGANGSLRKVRHVDRKFTWCTERANHIFSKMPALASAVVQERSDLLAFLRKQDWYEVQERRYHRFALRVAKLGITREVLYNRPFKTIGQFASCRKTLIGFLQVYGAVAVTWDVDELACLEPVCICDSRGYNTLSCRVHGRVNRLQRQNARRGKRARR